MSFIVEENEKSVAKVKLEIPREPLQEAIQKVFEKSKAKYRIPGFRPGKAPRSMIESRYGKDIFLQDALDNIMSERFFAALRESEFKLAVDPELVSIDSLTHDGATVTFELSLIPQFELQGYEGIPIGPQDQELTEMQIQALVDKEREKNARFVSTEAEAKEGDTLTIDYEGFMDGEAFEGGKGSHYSLTLGSNSFIPGFESQLIGSKAGDHVQVNVTFPENYPNSPALAGKPAVFEVDVQDVKYKELPEADDEFALDIGYDSLEDLKAALAKSQDATLKAKSRSEAEETIFRELVNRHGIDVAPRHVAAQAALLKQQYDESLKNSGIDPETYYSGEGREGFADFFTSMFLAQAEHQIKRDLILSALIEKEGIEASPEEKEEELVNYARDQGYDLQDLKSQMNENFEYFIETSIKQRKLFDRIIAVADTSPLPLTEPTQFEEDEELVLEDPDPQSPAMPDLDLIDEGTPEEATEEQDSSQENDNEQ